MLGRYERSCSLLVALPLVAEMRRRGLEGGIAGLVLAGVGVGLVAYNNARHSGICQIFGGGQCRVANDAWTAGLALLVVGVALFLGSILLAITTELRPVVPARPSRHLTLWIGGGVLLLIVAAVLAISLA